MADQYAREATHVLLVEPDDSLAQAHAEILRRDGIAVTITPTGGDAPPAIRNDESIDLVVVDVDLGEGKPDGVDVAKRCLAVREIAVVFRCGSTGDDLPSAISRLSAVRHFGYLTSRMEAPVVVDVIRSAIGRFRIEQELQLAEQRSRTLLKLSQMRGASRKEIADFVLEQLVRLTRSKVGFLGFLSDDGSDVRIHAWSREAMKACRITAPTLHFPAASSGIWAEAIRTKAPLVINNYDAPDERKHGLPEGHLPLTRLISVPVVENDRVVAVAAVGNKRSEYRETDVEEVALLLRQLWNLTQHEEADARLQASAERTKRILDTTQDGFRVADRDGVIREVNDAYCKMTGFSRDELIGMNVFELEPPENRGTTRRVRREAVVRGSVRYETHERRKNGTVFPVEVSKTYLPEDDGQFISFFRDISDRKQEESKLRDSEFRAKEKLSAILEPEGDISALSLAEIVDTDQVQALMDDFYELTHIGIAILDTDGNVLVSTGWQTICTQFHRVHPETRRNCVESDRVLTAEIEPGSYKLYKCRNHMWDMATPIVVNGKRVGNLFLGQFFFDDEPIDYEVFRAQAKRYGFDEDAYIRALDEVPRWSRHTVDTVMAFYTRFAQMTTSTSRANVQLARSLAEVRQLLQKLERSEKNLMAVLKEMNHRIKNNLAIVSALIRLKDDSIGDEIDLSDLLYQVDAIRAVHEKLYETDDVSHIEFRAYVDDILSTVFYSLASDHVTLENNVPTESISTRVVVSLGLIINEMAVNAVKYGFNDDEPPCFMVGLVTSEDGGTYTLTIENNGNRFPDSVGLSNPSTLGLRLISTLVEQINGEIELAREPDTRFTIRFPVPMG